MYEFVLVVLGTWKQYKKRHTKQLVINKLVNGAAVRGVLQY
jgi:hypothetical protein